MLRNGVGAAPGPILDGLQTIPALVYIIPAVVLFTVGAVPGIIASVLYAIVLIAMILDRFTQAWAARLQPPAG